MRRWKLPCPFTCCALLLSQHVLLATGSSCRVSIGSFEARLGIYNTITDPSGKLGNVMVAGPQRVAMAEGKLTMIVGAMVQVDIFASVDVPFQDSNVSLLLLEEPGLPNGAELTEQHCPRADGVCNPVKRSFRWEPRREQVGAFGACFLASVRGGAACEAVSRCFELVVVAPDISFLPAAADFSMPSANVGCLFRHCARAKDIQDLYAIDLSFSFEGLAFMQEGVCANDLSDPSSMLVSPLFAASTGTVVYAPAPCEKCISWRPLQGQEGRSFELCSYAHDQGSAQTVASCVSVLVEKCVFCLQGGESLLLLARRIGMEAQWQHLWNANSARLFPLLPDPDVISEQELAVQVGPSYRMKEEETVASMVMKFRTTAKMLMMFNPEMNETSWRKGAIVCVVPCTGEYSTTWAV